MSMVDLTLPMHIRQQYMANVPFRPRGGMGHRLETLRQASQLTQVHRQSFDKKGAEASYCLRSGLILK